MNSDKLVFLRDQTNQPLALAIKISPFLLWDKQTNSMFFLAQKITTLFFGLLTRTNQTNWVSLGLFCLAGNTWTKICCPFEGKDKLYLDWHKKLQLLFGFLFMRFLCHFCLARKIRQTWPLTFGRKKLDVLLTENN
jgi:hypothetical protein